ncbi:hemerythrin domain-containing protein [Nitrogeniibacter mangrovi]|uniref:Hemerythrin domain-containing protein n=1 Tax=Nitrogeniibacter mangrovi TaxID=2016596 RepID=A0A6C1B1H3_9RHOO|nr:hemerythrin domain-containing protein [Nitrogeniibacter mangrovi]QID17213.1 hemerythrin domain-containing protein [Nitrogeniibacter mangrovi]
MTESLIPIAPDLDEPLEILVACHGRMAAQLETLDRLVRWLPEHGADEDARRAATNVMRYFDTAAVNHHRDEEEDVFPLLLERCPPAARMRIRKLVAWVKDDHRALESAWAELRAFLTDIAEGRQAVLDADEVANFSAHYLNHIDREDNELFPFAVNVLTADDLKQLSKSMRARRTTTRAG